MTITWPWPYHGITPMTIPWPCLKHLCLGMIKHDHIMNSRLAAAQPWDTQDTAEQCSWMITNDYLWICYNHWPMYHHIMIMVQIMTRPWHDQELTVTWSYDDHRMTMAGEGHNHGVMVISWSFCGNAIVMLLSHHICHIRLVVLSWPYYSHPIYMVTYMLSWSSHGHGTGMM